MLGNQYLNSSVVNNIRVRAICVSVNIWTLENIDELHDQCSNLVSIFI